MHKLKLFLPLLLLPAFIACSSRQNAGDEKIDVTKVRTGAGFVSGKTNQDGSVKIFMGIPFAAPPVDSLRWKPPQPVQNWTGVRECVTPPPSAMQAKPLPFMMWSKEFMAPLEPLSEDCLYLNVWTPASSTGDKLPVMVWIHGGGFTGGSGTVPLYNGEEMAKKGVVFVTINYRLGVFGFLAHPELSAESPDSISGNYGILDQVAALTWVKNNITAFGGDPGNVTIDGQSAGSFSVNALMVSPRAKGLFHRAIGESGGMFAMNFGIVNTLRSSEEAGIRYLEQAGASSVADLRKMPADSLIRIPGRWGVTIDDHVVLQPTRAFMEGKQNDVPLISGWNADDGIGGKPLNAERFKENARERYGEKYPEFIKLFPAGDDEEAAASQKLLGQLSFGVQNYIWADLQSNKGTGKAYLYYFSHVPPGEPNYGAFHSSEFAYALNNLKLWDRPFVDADYSLADKMSSYWVNFATTGDPNGPGLPKWPAFNDKTPQVMEFGSDAVATTVPHLPQLEFLESLYRK
jgi:para-nitrobenzyl esterase